MNETWSCPDCGQRDVSLRSRKDSNPLVYGGSTSSIHFVWMECNRCGNRSREATVVASILLDFKDGSTLWKTLFKTWCSSGSGTWRAKYFDAKRDARRLVEIEAILEYRRTVSVPGDDDGEMILEWQSIANWARGKEGVDDE